MSVSKKTRDNAMKIILDFHKNKEPGHSIGPTYLAHHGLSDNDDAIQIVKVLGSMGLIQYSTYRDGSIHEIRPTDDGISYFEKEEDENAKTRKIFIHEWKIAGFSALAGAFFSKPLWGFLKWAWSLISH
nr:MAG TPA: hypothetical protein [Caudoviricetes sp.]